MENADMKEVFNRLKKKWYSIDTPERWAARAEDFCAKSALMKNIKRKSKFDFFLKKAKEMDSST